MNHVFSTSQLIGSISCSLCCTLPNEAETTQSHKTKMRRDRRSSSEIHSPCSIYRQGITDSSYSASPERMDSWQQVMQTDRAYPVQPTPKVMARVWQSSGTRAADGDEMMAYHDSSNREGCSLSKEPFGDSAICHSQAFLGNVSTTRYCFVDTEVLHKIWREDAPLRAYNRNFRL